MERKNFNYNKLSDSLIVSNRQENEKVKENFMFDDIIFSLTGKGKIVGIEIMNLSNFIKECGVDPCVIKNIKDIELKILQKKESIFILLEIQAIENSSLVKQKIPLVIPLVR